MLDLRFHVDGVEADASAVAPMLAFKLRVVNARPTEQIHSILLRCQIHLEVTRRRYDEREQEQLFDLFGPPPDWGRTLRRMLWAQVNASVPGFAAEAVFDLPVPCSYDLNVATTKYFHGLSGGEVPLRLLFSGTAFYATEDGRLQVAQIPWEKEALFRLPVRAWQDLMDRHYPNSGWLCLHKDVLDRLSQYKRQSGIPTWDQALESLLTSAEEKVPS